MLIILLDTLTGVNGLMMKSLPVPIVEFNHLIRDIFLGLSSP